MDHQLLARELLRSRSRALQEIQDKLEMMVEAINDVMYAREELEAMLLREVEIINELSARIGEAPTPPPRGFLSSYGVVLGLIVRVLMNDPPAP
ncbi:hypothetical protein DVH05_024564 [Phytophthora capsici]|nr:hypothetical protein DVH05_024564 [Phytophthora capsici]